MKLKKSSPLKLLSQSQPNFAEMIFLFLVMAAILDTARHWRTQFWKGTNQGSFQRSDELFNMYYRIIYELWTFTEFDRLCKLEKRGDEIKKNFPSETIYVKKLIIMLIQFKFEHFLAENRAVLGIWRNFWLCKLEKRGDEIKKNLPLWNYWANLNQALLKWFLGGPLPKLCRTIQWLFHKNFVLIEWPNGFRQEDCYGNFP
jgi:hypothetical protein